MRKAYLIVGPESSGTRVVTRLFVEIGCVGGFTHHQPLDKFVQGGGGIEQHGEDARFVFRRSVPHNLSWPDLGDIDKRFKEHGCETLWIVLVRDWYALAHSKARQGHTKALDEAYGKLVPQYNHIFKCILENDLNYILLSTSLMFVHPVRALRRLEEMTGLTFRKDTPKDVEAKYAVY